VEERARYLVEIASPESGWEALRAATARARDAAREMRAEGTAVRFVRSVFAPEDETCFFLYEAPSARAVEQVVERAGLRFDHVVRTSRAATRSAHTRREEEG
jgi:hypothetical protein